MAKRKPLPRAPKEPEEILSAAQQLLNYIRPYLKWLVGGGIVLVLGFAGWSGYAYLKHSREVQAQAALDKVRPLLSRPEQAEEALKALKALVDNHSGTKAALMARAFRGHLLYQGGKYAEAAKAYEDLRSEEAALREAGLSPFVTESLSYCYEAQGDHAKAARTLKPLLDQAEGNFQTLILARLALLYEKAGERQEAREAWQRLLSRSPSPALAAYWKEKLAEAQTPAAAPGSSGTKTE